MRNLKSLTVRQWGRDWSIAVAAIAFAFVLFTGLVRLLNAPAPSTVAVDPTRPPHQPRRRGAVPRIKATLYFASEDGLRLVPPSPKCRSRKARSRRLGRLSRRNYPPSPRAAGFDNSEGRHLRGIFISQRNEVFVDLDPVDPQRPPGGTLQELMTVYTIVNALLTNLPDSAGSANPDWRPGSGYARRPCGLAPAAQEE